MKWSVAVWNKVSGLCLHMAMFCVGLGCYILYTIEYHVNMMIQWIMHAEMLSYDAYQSTTDDFNSNKANRLSIYKMNYLGYYEMLSRQLYGANIPHCWLLMKNTVIKNIQLLSFHELRHKKTFPTSFLAVFHTLHHSQWNH